ncbi:MAG: hypothetical protein GY838_16625 [bacterium]|nr:hypothetical protein [bacterium]
MFLLCLLVAACSGQDKEDSAATEREELATQLRSLPYVSRSKVRQENQGLRGVVKHEDERSHAGLNLYGSMTHSRAYLRDMTGELVHTWNGEGLLDERQSFPLRGDLDAVDGISAPGFIVAELHGEHLLAIEAHAGLVKLDRDSRPVFALTNNAHHDLDTDREGNIHVLTGVPRLVEMTRGDVVIIDDVIQVVSAEGSVLSEHSVFEIIAGDPAVHALLSESLDEARYWFEHLDRWRDAKIEMNPAGGASIKAMFDLYDEAFVKRTRRLRRSHELYVLLLTPADVLHTNTLEVLDGRADGLWEEGHVLVSVRNLDLIAVLDLEAGRVVWSWGPGVVSRQHQPSLLPNGNLLVFDNGTARGRSRIIEMDPARGEIVWTHGETPASRFFCGAMGGVQRLPNGNTLITESAVGRAFEVDPAGRVVWDFFNPDRGYNPFEEKPAEETIESIYRLERVATDVVESLYH